MATDIRNTSDTDHETDPFVTRYKVQVLERALALLDALAIANKEVGPAELAAVLHLHKSTIHRLLKVLEGHRFVRRNQQGKYDLGLKLFELGNVSVSRFSLPKRAEPFLRDVVGRTGETAHLCVLSNIQMLSIASAEAPWIVRAIGHRGELHSSASVIATLSIAGPVFRMTRGRLTDLARTVVSVANALSLELGYHEAAS